ncbi:aquaporin [Actinomadura sp. NBRC 104412]|uniref:MIP/aquaporin family protein n=1 Tax=Actinomadura sp. NBRC 104412 TaxID=3032203 RepID=UPI0024A51FBD|nr:MIP family channel protein [Actinomadura sp. NBRC 104412]GLZ08633.1 aquaporin [Actinomadura sp. NBRC 104412]
MNRYIAEAAGTALLVFFGVGAAVFGLAQIGTLGVALAFGLVLLTLLYAIGPVSGAHLNPAVTVGFLVARRISATEAGVYIVAQVIGGFIGMGVIRLISTAGAVEMQVNGANSYGERINVGGAFLLEVIMTFMLVLVWLMVTRGNDVYAFDGLAIGLTLALVHLIGIPLTGTSVNPARSIGPALFGGSTALSQVWLFIVAPLVGGVLAALTEQSLRTSSLRTPNEPAPEVRSPR